MPEGTHHRKTFPPQREADTTSSSLLESDQSQERHILNNPIGNLDNWEKNAHLIVLKQ
jgi:hypothetical protein